LCEIVLQRVAVFLELFALAVSSVEYFWHCSVAVRCSVLQCVAVCYSAVQCVAVRLGLLTVRWKIDTSVFPPGSLWAERNTLQHIATHCNTLLHEQSAYVVTTHGMYPQLMCSCNTLQHTATDCNTLQQTATHCNTLQQSYNSCAAATHDILQGAATYCTTLQHTATHCNTLQQMAAQCSHTATHCITLQHTAIQNAKLHRNALQQTATHGNTLQHADNTRWLKSVVAAT